MTYSSALLLHPLIHCFLFFFALRGVEEKSEKAEGGEEVKIVAVDLQAMAPLPGVTQIQGDITKVRTCTTLLLLYRAGRQMFRGEPACPGSP